MPFVVGVPRSGTTLLRLMLDAHPELAIPHETHFLPSLLREPPDSREAFFRRVTEFSTWKDLSTPQELFWDALCRLEPFDVIEGVRAFYRLYAGLRGKSRWGDKSPPYCLHIETIQRALPEARFIHILRDGRDVAVSLRPLWFAPGTSMQSLAAQWVEQITEARRQGQGKPFYLEVRYEDLIAQPEREMQRICRFVDLRYDPAMEDYHQSARSRLSEVETHRSPEGQVLITKEERLHLHRFTSQPPEPSRIGRWRTELTRKMVDAYEGIAGELLDELGYEPSPGRRSWFRRWFFRRR
jgi:hypothetical protein